MSRIRFLATLACAALVFVRLAPAQAPAATGALTGRVLNTATGEYASAAEIRIDGTNLLAVTESDGTYRLPGVPAGLAVVTVTYTGSATERAPVQIEPGRTVSRDFELKPALPGGAATAQEILKLGAFVVSTEREGNAKAIMEQRNSMNLTNSVSSDFFGDVAEGNVGEFLKNMPGVDIEYVGPDSRGPRLRGLDPQYIGVSVDGLKLASGDASQAVGDGARSFSFDQVSVNSIDRIEVNYTSSADQDANAPAGTINLKTKRAFERKGRRVSWQVNVMANADNFDPSPSYGPGDKKTYKFRPGGIFEYSDQFLNNRLGIILNLSESNQYALQWRMNYTYAAAAPTPADPRPRVITGVAFLQQPKFSERFTPTLTVDYKATEHLVLSLSAMYNYYDTVFDGRTANFTAPNRAAVGGDGMTSFTFNNASLALSQNHSHKVVDTTTLTPRFEYRRGPLLLDGAFSYSISTNQYEGLGRTGPVNTPTNALTGLTLQLTRSGARENDWTLRQTAGRDFADLSGFTNPRVNDEQRFAENEIFQGQLNARFTLPWRTPTWVKVGTKATEEYRRFRNPNPALTYLYNGPGGGAAGSFADVAFPDYRWELGYTDVASLSGRPPTFPNRMYLGALFRERPDLFTDISTPANFFTAYIANASYIKERSLASYAMANTRLRALQLQAGIRWEDTHFATREFDARPAAEVRAAGFAITPANGRATTIPGLVYQFMSRPKVTRTSGYDNLFPSASAKYNLTPSLQAHVGFSSTISRPAITNLGGVWVFNETERTVDVPNPNLLPERSKNYTGRLAYYFEPVGSVALTAFQNDISDSVTNAEFPAAEFGYDDDPTYSTFRFLSVDNRSGITRVRGYTLEYSQALSFLPGALKGLNASASYTRTYANTIKPGMVPHMLGGTLSYRHKRLSLGVSGKYTDTTPFTATGNITYRKLRTMIDLNGAFQLTRRTSVFFHARNIFNTPEYRYQVDPTFITQYVTFGPILTFGLKGSF